jgi:type IV secretion system protein VirB2
MKKQNVFAKVAQIVAAAAVIVLGFVNPAFAQLQQATTVLTNVQTVLVGLGVVVVTIAILWAGFKMVFQHHKWSEIAHIVMGAIFIGGASAIAGWLIG